MIYATYTHSARPQISSHRYVDIAATDVQSYAKSIGDSKIFVKVFDKMRMIEEAYKNLNLRTLKIVTTKI